MTFQRLDGRLSRLEQAEKPGPLDLAEEIARAELYRREHGSLPPGRGGEWVARLEAFSRVMRSMGPRKPA